MNAYGQDASTVYANDSSMHFSNHYDTHPTYASYDSNNNFGDQQQQHHHQHYGLLRPAIESDMYSSYYAPSSVDIDPTNLDQSTSISSIVNENLLHNLNHSSMSNHTLHYTDLSSMASSTSNMSMEKHYDFVPSSSLATHGTPAAAAAAAATTTTTTAGPATTTTTTTTTAAAAAATTTITAALNDINYHPQSHHHHHKGDDRSVLPMGNENNFHWNQATCVATQW
jgi:hypothetical protein